MDICELVDLKHGKRFNVPAVTFQLLLEVSRCAISVS
jgi:hypothetical protein